MEFDEYQKLADLTDQFADKREQNDLILPLLGLSGEIGTLLSEFKKHIRDKESYEGFNERAQEELGDVLWYLANLATRLDLSLSEIAAKNLRKTEERWPISGKEKDAIFFFDDEYPINEQLPRVLKIQIKGEANTRVVSMTKLPENKIIGAPITDNAYEDDGYRYHDVFHLAHMAVLRWSPIMRRFLQCKRKSDARVDEIEDGARAGIIEELIVAYVYNNAVTRKFYAGIKHLDTELLSNIKRLVSGFEVVTCPTQDWENAILQGYAAFRHLRSKGSGIFEVDLKSRLLNILE